MPNSLVLKWKRNFCFSGAVWVAFFFWLTSKHSYILSWLLLHDCLQEATIEEYFKPIDREAQIIMNMQLEGEEKTMREMMKAMQEQAVLEKAAAEKMAKMSSADANYLN